MIEYHENADLVVMDLVDLEHCGFDHRSFNRELFLAGIGGRVAKWPVAILVNMVGGQVVTPDTRPEMLAAMEQAQREFEALLARLRGGEWRPHSRGLDNLNIW